MHSTKEPICQNCSILPIFLPNVNVVSVNFKHQISIFWGSNGRKIKHREAQAKSVMLIKKTLVTYVFKKIQGHCQEQLMQMQMDGALVKTFHSDP